MQTCKHTSTTTAVVYHLVAADAEGAADIQYNMTMMKLMPGCLLFLHKNHTCSCTVFNLDRLNKIDSTDKLVIARYALGIATSDVSTVG